MSKRSPENLEEYLVYTTLQDFGYFYDHIKFSTWRGKSKRVSVEVKNEEISDEAAREIKNFYPDSYKDWDDDKDYRRYYLILKP